MKVEDRNSVHPSNTTNLSEALIINQRNTKLILLNGNMITRASEEYGALQTNAGDTTSMI